MRIKTIAREKKVLRDTVAEGLRIQHWFRPEPLYKTTGRGSYKSNTVDEIATAKKDAVTAEMKRATQSSGQLELLDGTLSYRVGDHEWSVPAANVRLVGEYTTPNGPFVDDYFLVFLASAGESWNQASFYAAGRDEMLLKLGEILGAKLELGLCNSAEFKSRVIWPLDLAGRSFFELIPADSAFGRFKQKWLGADFQLGLTQEVKSALK